MPVRRGALRPFPTVAFPLAIPDISIESLEGSCISRWSLEVLDTMFRCLSFDEIETLES